MPKREKAEDNSFPESSPQSRDNSCLFPQIRHEITVLIPNLLFKEAHPPLNKYAKLHVDTFFTQLHLHKSRVSDL
jgi:hypothetical protein